MARKLIVLLCVVATIVAAAIVLSPSEKTLAHTPASLVVTGRTDTSVSLDWTQNPYDHAYSGYYIRTNDGARVLYSSSQATIGGLTPGTSYKFCVSVNYTSTSDPDESPQSCITVSTTGGAPTPPSEPDYESPLWRPYAVSSQFNKPVGSSPVISPNGQNIVNRVLAGSSGTNGPGNIILNDPNGEVSHARFHAKSTDPSYRINATNSWCQTENGRVIRIPQGATPAGGWNNPFNWSGWDGHMSVTQPRDANGVIWEYDFYQGRSIISGSPGVINADCAGREDVENGDGNGTGTTVANFALMAGQLRANELLSWPTPKIDHALFMTIPCSNGQRVSWLQTTGSGSVCSNTTNAAPLGQRFYLAYTDAQISALPAYARPWVQAMKDYGMYFGDTGGPADFGLQATLEASNTYLSIGKTNPIQQWAQSVGLGTYNGKYILKLRSPDAPIDWTKLRAIQP